jgi:hypothetical protein
MFSTFYDPHRYLPLEHMNLVHIFILYLFKIHLNILSSEIFSLFDIVLYPEAEEVLGIGNIGFCLGPRAFRGLAQT